MATFAADILSTFSGSPGDGGARNVRETSLNPTGSRRGFSSVLRSVRGHVGRATVREAEDARPVNKANEASYAKETKGLNGSTQQERPHASSRATEGTRTSSNDDKFAGDPRDGVESSTRQNDAGSGPQDQGPVSMSNLISVPAQPQVVDQPDVQTETKPYKLSDETSVDRSSQHPLISHESVESFTTTTSEANEGRSSLSRVSAASDLSSTQQSHPAELQAHDDGLGVSGVERGSQKVVKDSGRIAADLSGPPPVHKDVIPAVPLGLQNPGIPQVVQASVEKPPLEGMVFVAKAETVKHDGEPADHSVSSQTARQGHVVGDHQALDASTDQSFSHGRQFANEGSEPFREPRSGHDGRQMGTGEPKIAQPFVVDPTLATGSLVESTVPGSSRQAISPPGTPAQTSFVTQVQSGLQAQDMAQSAGVPVMRSVVVNVTQPDLGHVNIRVAMTNDVVHTHFFSDRLEVGQFFINGQDRLQAALQASGLDMGQFRVDIDRQNGGRSFQQGPFQEHGQSWNQASHGMGQEPHDQQDQTRGTLHGLLNLVA